MVTALVAQSPSLGPSPVGWSGPKGELSALTWPGECRQLQVAWRRPRRRMMWFRVGGWGRAAEPGLLMTNFLLNNYKYSL